MRLILFIPFLLALTACLKAPETDAEPTVEQAIAEAIGQSTGQEIEPEKPGLFAFLKPKPAPTPEPTADIALVTADNGATAEQEAGITRSFGPNDPVPSDEAAETKATGGGLFGFLKRTVQDAPVDASNVLEPADDPVQTAALSPDATDDTASRRGLFGAGSRAKSTVEPGQVLPFGEVGIACGMSQRDLGKVVDQFPSSGRAVWKLHDTNPSATGPRTQFVTGFSDGCARQFTAALALFGSAGMHEIHRYSPARKNVPYSKTDNTYEKIKQGICGVRTGVPCPSGRSDRLAKSTSFLTLYPRFVTSGIWHQLLLHKGSLVVSETRSQ